MDIMTYRQIDTLYGGKTAEVIKGGGYLRTGREWWNLR